VTQLITALVSIHSSMTFLADIYGFLDPSSRTVLFSVDDSSLFVATADRRIKTRKNWVPASSDEDLVMRSKRQNKVLKFWLWYMNFLLRIVIPTKWIYFSISLYCVYGRVFQDVKAYIFILPVFNSVWAYSPLLISSLIISFIFRWIELV